ncbi:MAG: chemotaxis protein CheW [Pseudomonadota bacterium]
MSAFNYLQELDQKFTSNPSAPLSEASQSIQTLHFKVGQYDFLLPLDNSTEVLMTIDYASVPISRPWLVGVASHRGELLTLVDLKNFLFNSDPVKRLSNHRVITNKNRSLYLGVVVDQVMGILNISEHEKRNSYPAHWDSAVTEFMTGVYYLNDTYYGICDIHAILQDKSIYDAQKTLN